MSPGFMALVVAVHCAATATPLQACRSCPAGHLPGVPAQHVTAWPSPLSRGVLRTTAPDLTEAHTTQLRSDAPIIAAHANSTQLRRAPRPIVGCARHGRRGPGQPYTGPQHSQPTRRTPVPPPPPPCHTHINYMCTWVQAEVELMLNLQWLTERANRGSLVGRKHPTTLATPLGEDTCTLPTRMGDWAIAARCSARRRLEVATHLTRPTADPTKCPGKCHTVEAYRRRRTDTQTHHRRTTDTHPDALALHH